MPTLSTNVDPLSPSYVDNRQAVLARLDELHEALAPGRNGYGNTRPVARERVELLLDRDAPFLELGPLAGWSRFSVAEGNSTRAESRVETAPRSGSTREDQDQAPAGAGIVG